MDEKRLLFDVLGLILIKNALLSFEKGLEWGDIFLDMLREHEVFRTRKAVKSLRLQDNRFLKISICAIL
ncbi:hypothetical protein [Sporobacter termitidis]|uniref:hypothetical protein n=1 Tax=Sporobacter termitidis TaxID=44749 RepID=UPI0009326070|nr:hypothetical protein [Sporobacter termitidis]